MKHSDSHRRLMWHGILLFLLGSLQGFALQAFHNPRMALSAHLAGLMNGIFLVLLGLLWRETSLAPRAATTMFWLALYGTYFNWAALVLAAIFGTSSQTPLAGGSRTAAVWQEYLVNFGLISTAVAVVVCCVLILWGLRKKA